MRSDVVSCFPLSSTGVFGNGGDLVTHLNYLVARHAGATLDETGQKDGNCGL